RAEWAHMAGHGSGQAIATGNDGHVVVAGELNGELLLGGDLAPPEGESIGFVLELDADGELLWALGYDGNVQSAAVTSTNTILLAGSFSTVTGWGGPDAPAVLVALDSDGSYAWSVAGSSRATGVAVDALDEIYLTGFAQGSADLGGGTILADN